MSTTVYLDRYGNPAVLKRADEALSGPDVGQVQVSNRSISVNPADLMVIAGLFRGYLPLRTRYVPGVESAGVVRAVGRGVSKFKIGDEVIRVGESDAYRFGQLCRVRSHYEAR
jgi:NADPH:quinone reductase-like Zn-dependent oxidoreductase